MPRRRGLVASMTHWLVILSSCVILSLVRVAIGLVSTAELAAKCPVKWVHISLLGWLRCLLLVLLASGILDSCSVLFLVLQTQLLPLGPGVCLSKGRNNRIARGRRVIGNPLEVVVVPRVVDRVVRLGEALRCGHVGLWDGHGLLR